MLDNARTHKTVSSIQSLNRAFVGLWLFSSPYSPFFKPVENGFKLVKEWLRDHEDEALANPIEMINRAFFLFSSRGPNGRVCRNFWNIYLENNEI